MTAIYASYPSSFTPAPFTSSFHRQYCLFDFVVTKQPKTPKKQAPNDQPFAEDISDLVVPTELEIEEENAQPTEASQQAQSDSVVNSCLGSFEVIEADEEEWDPYDFCDEISDGIYEEDERFFDDSEFEFEVEFFSKQLYNLKKANYGRSKQKNKKEKISATHYHVNGPRQNHHEARKQIAVQQYEKQKANGSLTLGLDLSQRQSFGQSPPSSYYSTSTPSKSTSRVRAPWERSREDREMERAMRLSAQEYARQSSGYTTQVGLTQRQIEELLTRELTPEDYEVLLMLDQSVQKKTVSATTIQSFVTVTIEADTEERCTVCMVNYEKGDVLKKLPCGHMFHSECIEQWLTTSSVNCPIDNLPVT